MAGGRFKLWSGRGRHRARAALLNDFTSRAELIALILLDLISLGRAGCTLYQVPWASYLLNSSQLSFQEVKGLPTPFLPQSSAPSSQPLIQIFKLLTFGFM